MNHRPLSLEKVTAYIKKEYLYLGALIGFIVLATVISSSFSRDSVAYNSMFARYGSSGWSAFTTEILQRETIFLAVSKILYQLGLGSVFLFFSYAAISVSIKFHLINEHSKDKWLSLAFFSSYFFILLDATQIRFSIAIAFVYLGLHFLAENRKLLFVVIVFLSAVMFHMSILAFIIMLLFTSNKSLYWLFGMIVLAIVLYPVNLYVFFLDVVGGVVNHFDINGTFLNKVHTYLLRQGQTPAPLLGMFRPIMLLLYACAFVVFQKRRGFNTYEILCYNAFILSIFFYISLKDVVILQVRFTDMFGFSLVFLVPFIHSSLSFYIGKRNAYIMLLSFFSVYLLKFTLYDKMLVF